MKKVGIITHYYQVLNYGGTLQAYALCRVLREMGCEAEQICYDMRYDPKRETGKTHRLRKRISLYARNPYMFFKWRKRIKSVAAFQKQIPHSKTVYHKDNIGQAGEQYDVFVTGSDQVWNTKWYHPAFFLNFVPADKKKVSYAASLGKIQLDEKTYGILLRNLQDYAAISVREDDAVEMVSLCAPVPVVKTLDPTLLLTAQQWDEIATKRIVKRKYIFSFLLGDGKAERQAVRRFADAKGLKVVTLPHFPGAIREADKKFGDISLYDITPGQFISLIKHAEYVFTDSFHGAVFSNLYEKEYFVFERSGGKNMRSRVVSLLSFFGCTDRFLDQPEKMAFAYIESVPKTDYSAVQQELKREREASMAFLRKNVAE